MTGVTLPLLIPIDGLAPIALPVLTTDQLVIQRGSITYSVDASIVNPVIGAATRNTVLAGPVSGAPATPTYRSLVADDVPGALNATDFSGAVTVNGTTTINGGLDVTGASVFSGNVTAIGTTLLVGTLDISGALAVSGNSTLIGTATISGATNVGGTLNSSGSMTAGSGSANKLTLAGGSTGNGPTITASGTDTNIDVRVIPQGTGQVHIQGSGSLLADSSASVGSLSQVPADSLTATGTNQATALLLANTYNRVSISPGSGAGVALPITLPGRATMSGVELVIRNDGANSLLIYPPVGGTINGSGSSLLLNNGGTHIRVCCFSTANSLTWYTL